MKGRKRGLSPGRKQKLSPPPASSTRLGSRERAEPPPQRTHRSSTHTASHAKATERPTRTTYETVSPSVESQAVENFAFAPRPRHEERSGADRSGSSFALRTGRPRNRRTAAGRTAGLLPSASVLGTGWRSAAGLVAEAPSPSSQPAIGAIRSTEQASRPSTGPSKASSPRCSPGCLDTSAARCPFRMPRIWPR
jgi:hypothetical protein